MIRNLLVDNGINPNTINLNYVQNSKIDQHSECLAEAKSPRILFTITKENIHIPKKNNFMNGSITIYPSFSGYEKTIRQAMCLHEISHIVLQHTNDNDILSTIISEQKNIPTSDIKKSKEWKQLIRIEEAEAEIVPATQCHIYADLLVTLRKNQFYPQCLFVNHYKKLKTISLYWNLIALLEKKQKINCEK